MCNQANLSNGLCKINKEICPFLYYCSKIHSYKELRTMPSKCKVLEQFEMPEGFYKVSYENNGNLYVEVNGYIEIIANPYDYIPLYVKLFKIESDWKIEQVMG